MKQHFLRLWAGFAHNCNQLVSIWDSGVKGRVTGDFKCCLPSGKTLTYTHTQHANAASAVLAILAEEMTSQWVGRGRKGRGGQVHSSESQGASTFGSSVNPLGTVRGDLLVLEPSYSVEHLLCTKHFARCFTLCRRQVGWDAGQRSRLDAKALYCFEKW